MMAASNSEETFNLLLNDNRNDPSQINYRGKTLLHFVASEGSKHTLEMLLKDDRFDPFALDYSGRTPLHLAVMNRNRDWFCTTLLKMVIWKF
jgi:ankyrin repeat protein